MTNQKSIPSKHPDFIRAIFDRAVKMIEGGQLNSAEVLLETLADEETVREQFAYLRGIVASGLDQKRVAQLFFKQALQINPSNAQAHAWLGYTLLDEHPAHAAAAFAAALTLKPNQPNWNAGLAQAFGRTGLRDLAKENIDDAVRQAPDHPQRGEWAALIEVEGVDLRDKSKSSKFLREEKVALCDALLMEARRHQGDGDLARARKIFETLLEIDETHQLALCNFAVLEHSVGNFERARQLTHGVKELLERLPPAHTGLVHIRLALITAYVALGDATAAHAEVSSVLSLAPNDAVVQADCAMALHETGAPQEALTHFERAIAIDQRQSADFYRALGSTLLAINEPSRAEIVFKHAAELAPKFKPALLGLFETYLVLGRRNDAKAQLNLIVSIDPSNQEIEKLQRRLNDNIAVA